MLCDIEFLSEQNILVHRICLLKFVTNAVVNECLFAFQLPPDNSRTFDTKAKVCFLFVSLNMLRARHKHAQGCFLFKFLVSNKNYLVHLIKSTVTVNTNEYFNIFKYTLNIVLKKLVAQKISFLECY